MGQKLRIVHYLNQFFGGIGGEEKADTQPQTMDGPVGPGRAISQMLGEKGDVVGTVICGDNFYADNTSAALEQVLEMIDTHKPDLFLAGPAFNAGRYGTASGEISKAVQEKLNIPAVSAMFEENPGVDLYCRDVYIVKSQDSVRGMTDAVAKMVAIGLKLVENEKIGPAVTEGYFPRGDIKNEFTDKNAASRAVDMLIAKIKKAPFTPELELPKFDRIPPAQLEKPLSGVTIALVTDGGLVPKGNPDNMASNRSTGFAAYDVSKMNTLNPEEFEANHMGFDTELVNLDPNRLVPLDILQELANEGRIDKVHTKIYTTAGVATSLGNAQNIGRGIAEAARSEGVDAAILTST